MELDWHADRSDLLDLVTLDQLRAQEPTDLAAVRAYRLGRLREQMAAYGLDACVLLDPVNIRYATGARNMQVFHSRNPARYLFVAQAGPVILHEFAGCAHLAEGLETVDEVRPAITASYVAAGDAIGSVEVAWAKQVAALVREHCGTRAAVGLERVNAGAALALREEGFALSDAQAPVERARAIKSEEELKCVRASVAATEVAVARLRDAMRPGVSENELWSVLHQGVIALGGDYVETRLLSSGERTNPWFQETGERRLGENELVALDTDVVGCHGYYCDFSRTFHTGPATPSPRQRELYRVAHEQVHHNMQILAPGVSFREYSERAWAIPDRYVANRYFVSAHGCGMTGEYPYLYHSMDYEQSGYDGVIEPGMTICVESYIGEEGGAEGVKLEQQLLITDDGNEPISTFPFETALLQPPA
ncbi:MAG TPA: Xaa-Pro peptidase family protein [Solirubrobacteraceae bacterium]|nr:Xaa-Pro peptidase family protein [Solirubrobacteraceae bacterium]